MALRFIETDIEIEAPAAEVWRVLSDFDHWPQWHPFVSHVSGRLHEGEGVAMRKGSGDRSLTVRQKVAMVRDGEEFRLAGRLGPRGLLDNEHRFRVEPITDTRSRFLHGQAFRGLLVRFMIRKRGAASYEVFEQINEALKRRVEQRSP